MKIAILAHFYPPTPGGGAMIYAATVAEALRRSNMESYVLCAGDWDTGLHHFNGYTDETYNEVPVRRLHVNWSLAPRPFDYLYNNPVLAPHIREYLEAVKPDLVHVVSCYTLSAQAIEVPRSLNLPTIVHLVDMWFICPRHTLLRKSGELCFGSQGDWDCQRCLLWGTKAYQVTSKIANDDQQRRLYERLGKHGAIARLPSLHGTLGNMGQRRKFVLNSLLHAQAILAPSRSIQQLHEANGVPPGLITYLPYGHTVAWASQVKRQPAERLRVGFLGNVILIKGVHVLVEAFRQLGTAQAAELHIYGYADGDLAYTAKLKRHDLPNVFFHGQYSRSDLPRIFSEIDVTVVPSIWHENTPLVIQEAFAAGCPVISSNISGAAESVENEINGLHFNLGDATDLARQIARITNEPGLLARLQSGIRPVRTIEAELTDLQEVYRRVVTNHPKG